MAVEDGPLKKAIRQSLIDNNLREAEPHEISKSRKVALISLKENNGVTIKSDSLGLSYKGLVESEFVKDDIFNIDDVIDWYFIK